MPHPLEGLIDLPRLETFLRTRLPPQEGELVVEKHEAGFSNETFYVSWGPKRWVMRRPPRGDILPTAHDMLREYRVLSGLAPTGVRAYHAPRLLAKMPRSLALPFISWSARKAS